MTKSGREIVEILEAFDLTGTAWSPAQLAGCGPKTAARYAAIRNAGGDPQAKTARPKLIDSFMPKIEEMVDRSRGKVRADVVHRKISATGYTRSEWSTRRTQGRIAKAKGISHTAIAEAPIIAETPRKQPIWGHPPVSPYSRQIRFTVTCAVCQAVLVVSWPSILSPEGSACRLVLWCWCCRVRSLACAPRARRPSAARRASRRRAGGRRRTVPAFRSFRRCAGIRVRHARSWSCCWRRCASGRSGAIRAVRPAPR